MAILCDFCVLVRDAFVIDVRPSVCPSGTGVHYDHTMHVSADLSLRWIVQCSGHPDTKACPPTPSRLFSVPPGKEVGIGICKLDVISQKRAVEDRGEC